MHVRVDRAGRQYELWFARVADRWETIFDLGTHDVPILLPPLRYAETELHELPCKQPGWPLSRSRTFMAAKGRRCPLRDFPGRANKRPSAETGHTFQSG